LNLIDRATQRCDKRDPSSSHRIQTGLLHTRGQRQLSGRRVRRSRAGQGVRDPRSRNRGVVLEERPRQVGSANLVRSGRAGRPSERIRVLARTSARKERSQDCCRDTPHPRRARQVQSSRRAQVAASVDQTEMRQAERTSFEPDAEQNPGRRSVGHAAPLAPDVTLGGSPGPRRAVLLSSALSGSLKRLPLG